MTAPYTQVGKEVLFHGKHFADAADVMSAVRIVSALNVLTPTKRTRTADGVPA